MFTKISKIITIAGFLVVSSLNSIHAQDFITAKEFDARCVKEGAVNVVDELSKGDWDNPVWVNILDNIASGDEEWIKASTCIGKNSGYSNVNVGIDINIVWAEALPKNPQAILALDISGVSTRRACSLPFIEPERAWAAQYVKDTLAALEAIPDDATMWNIPLAIERDVCILRLKDAYAKKYDYAD